MKKKIYTTPALSVEEYEMTIITSASQLQSVENNAGLNYGGGGSDPAMGKGRGIWDED